MENSPMIQQQDNSKPFSLKEFVSYENPNRNEYEKFIQVVAQSQSHWKIDDMDDARTVFDRGWRLVLKQENALALFEYLKQKISGEILIDLGGSTGGNMEFIARMMGARVYITVDKYIETEDESKTESQGEKTQIVGTQKVVVKSDLLDFLSKLPDNSVNVTINGIDSLIIPSSDYHRALAKELSRVVRKGGIVFGINSDALELNQKDLIFENKDEFQRIIPQGTILEKK